MLVTSRVSVDILNSLSHWLSQCDSRFCVVHASNLAQALTCLRDLFIARLEIKKSSASSTPTFLSESLLYSSTWLLVAPEGVGVRIKRGMSLSDTNVIDTSQYDLHLGLLRLGKDR